MANAEYAYVNGEIVPFADAKVHISSVGFKFGAGVFEGLRGYWNPQREQMYLFRMAEHMRRIEFSQTFMRFEEVISGATVEEKTLALLRANALHETVHIMTTCFVSGFGAPTATGPIDLAIVTAPKIGSGLAETGANVQVSSWQRLPDNVMPVRVKCNANYQNGRLAAMQSHVDGYDTALFLNTRGKVAEGHGMCFFMFRDGCAITPTLTSDILESITRATVIELLREDMGIEVIEREVDRSELALADEAFFCGTAWEVTPVVSIDRMSIGGGFPGPLVQALRKRYLDVALGTVDDYPHWRTAVY